MRSVLGDFVLYGASDVAGRFLLFLLIPFFSRTLPEQEFGAVDFSLSLIVLYGVVAGLQMESGLVRHFYEEEKKGRLRQCVSTAVWVWVVSGAGFVVVLAATREVIAHWVFPDVGERAETWFVLAVGGAFVHMLFQQSKTVLRLERRAWLYAAINVIPFALFAGLAIPSVLADWGITGVLGAFIVAYTIAFIMVAFSIRKLLDWTFDWKLTRVMLRYSVPLLPNTAGGWGFRHGLRFVILGHFSLGTMAVYAIADKVGMIVAAINMIFWKATSPHVWRAAQGSETFDRQYRRLCHSQWGGLTVLLSVLLVFMWQIVTILGSDKYAAATGLGGWLAASMVVIEIKNRLSIGINLDKRTYLMLPGIFLSLIVLFGGLFTVFGVVDAASFGLEMLGIWLFGSACVWLCVNSWIAQLVRPLKFCWWKVVGTVLYAGIGGWLAGLGLPAVVKFNYLLGGLLWAYWVLEREDRVRIMTRMPWKSKYAG